jgi:hypothetical protein
MLNHAVYNTVKYEFQDRYSMSPVVDAAENDISIFSHINNSKPSKKWR